MQSIAEDHSDPQSQKAVFMFFSRCVTTWARLPGDSSTAEIPGFDRVVYERLVPTAFTIPSAPTLNPRDGQTIVVGVRCFRSTSNDVSIYFLGDPRNSQLSPYSRKDEGAG